MANQLGEHQETKVGGPLDDERLAAIMSRGYLFRNLAVSPTKALEYQARTHELALDGSGEVPWSEYGGTQHLDGETPTIVYGIEKFDGEDDPSTATYELHMGCGDLCGVFAAVPYDPDMGHAPRENAEAIAHAGRDLIDLVREVRELRRRIQVATDSLADGDSRAARAALAGS